MFLRTVAACAAISAACLPAMADNAASTRPDSHAPISVMGDHTHKAGEVMFSYRFMQMAMEGNREGTSDLSAAEVASTPGLRVVPTDMTMDMHMFGAMWAPTDRVTLMLMTSYIEKEMDHITFAGPAGTTVVGEFTTETSGLGDTSVSALVCLSDTWHATVGISVPTGDLDETDQILSPMNTRPTPRLPYPMQLGSGTYDLIAGLTYAGHRDDWGWGAQWRSVIRTGENDEDYTLGDEHRLQGWVSYRVSDAISISARLAAYDRGNIDGRDPLIAAPVQTADPDRQGIQRLDLALGANWLLPGGKHRVALELAKPIRQDLDGPQMETDAVFTVGWQLAL